MTLSEIVDREYELRKESENYWGVHIQPQIELCKTKKDVLDLMRSISYECSDKDGQIRDMPFDYRVNFIMILNGKEN